MPATYTRNGEWSGYSVHKSETGFVVEYWSRIQGQSTDGKYLLPYGVAGMGKDTDLEAQYNNLYTNGMAVAEIFHSNAKCLRKGHIVQ